jgi:DNA-3-methyladenine glycosylase
MASGKTKKPTPPDPRLQIDFRTFRREGLPREFFRLDTEHVARALIGTWFLRKCRNQWYGARIVETEAYLGVKDAAAHSFQGRRTRRVEPMYRDGGHLYVYFVYGMHYCANVVTRDEGIPEAVLLRAAEGPDRAPIKLLSGPGKLCAALGITAESSGVDLLSSGDFLLLKPKHAPANVGVSRRIGVDYAGAAAAWPLRFFDRNSAAVSGPARLKWGIFEP